MNSHNLGNDATCCCRICASQIKSLSDHVRKTHKIDIIKYRQIIADPAELAQYQQCQGFTDVYGQCGYCLKTFGSLFSLRIHKKSCTEAKDKGVKVYGNGGNGFNMETMRKLRDQGHFKNSMQAEIDQDKQLDEVNEQLDRLRAELQAKIIACEVEAMKQGIDVEAIRNERRREWNEAEMKLEFNEN